MHGLDGQHQYVDRTPRERVNQNDRGQINGESTSMVWPALGSRTAKEQTYIKQNVCVCVCVCSLFLMHGHTFEQICTKFGMWHTYDLHTVMGVVVSDRRSNCSI